MVAGRLLLLDYLYEKLNREVQMDTITFRKAYDGHRHVRDDAVLQAVADFADEHFCGGIIMPNLKQPVVTMADAIAYRKRVVAALGPNATFEPHMTLYLTDHTDPEDLAQAFLLGIVKAAKLYPLHGTTNSAHAVTDYAKIQHVLTKMEQIGMPLLIHGERPTQAGLPVDHYEREALYVRSELQELREAFPDLPICLEHISSLEAAEQVMKFGDENFRASLCPHHLVTDRRFTMYTTDGACMPAIKAERHKLALQALVASGCPWVHLGTDCAPHIEGAKQAVQCACGCFTGPHAIALYLEAFEAAGALQYFEDFASVRGPRFFGFEPSTTLVTYRKENWQIDKMVEVKTSDPYSGDIDLIRPFGYRTPDEEARGLGKNRTMTWRQAA